MDQGVLDYVRSLSARDTKTLTQRALKLCEETGELAKAVLPYESTPSTLHRVVTKNKVAEEAVDTILVALSILHQLEYTDVDISSLMMQKSGKWDNILDCEDKLGDPSKIPHEIHVTVNLNGSTVEYFKNTCAQLAVKPIVLDLPIGDGKVMQDVMTSSHTFSTTTEAIETSYRLGCELEKAGFIVVRDKVETVPWHPHAPQMPKDEIHKGCYFEAHVGILMDSNMEDEVISNLQFIAWTHQAHMSRNVFKRYDNGSYVQMVTIRSYRARVYFDLELDDFLDSLKSAGFTYDKVIREYAIHDSSVDHDKAWIGNEQL